MHEEEVGIGTAEDDDRRRLVALERGQQFEQADDQIGTDDVVRRNVDGDGDDTTGTGDVEPHGHPRAAGRSANFTTSQVGVAISPSGRKNRKNIVPRLRPSVSIQLG